MLRSFYEIKQFDQKWNFKTKNHLKIINFQLIIFDNCVFFWQIKTNHFDFVYWWFVDFFSVSQKHQHDEKKIISKISYEKMKKIIFILNIRIKRDTDKQFIVINQIIYIKKFLHKYKMKNVHLMIVFIDDYLLLISSNATKARID